MDIDKLEKYIIDKPLNNFYHAVISEYNDFGKKLKFGSGSGYFLSKNLVKEIIENKEKWEHNYVDDVALGKLLYNMNIEPTLAPRLDIDSYYNNEFYIMGHKLDTSLIKDHYHFRCKTNGDRSGDIEIMKNLKIKIKICTKNYVKLHQI